VGDGPLYYMLQDFKRRISIKYYYRVPYEKIVEIYNLSKILLTTFRYKGIQSIMLEGLACGIPIVASRIGGIQEMIKDRNYGFLVDINNLDEVAKICLRLIENQIGTKIYSKTVRE